jgi:hypothetical protein
MITPDGKQVKRFRLVDPLLGCERMHMRQKANLPMDIEQTLDECARAILCVMQQKQMGPGWVCLGVMKQWHQEAVSGVATPVERTGTATHCQGIPGQADASALQGQWLTLHAKMRRHACDGGCSSSARLRRSFRGVSGDGACA